MSQPRAATAVAPNQAPEARERISVAAFRLFGEKGYSCTSVQDIADAAEVQKSILYYYFGSKEGLYQTLFSESSTRLQGFLIEALTQVGFSVVGPDGRWRVDLPEAVDCGTLLGALAETLLMLARDHREPVRFFMAHIFAPDADRPPVSMQEMDDVAPQLIQLIARAGILRGELAGEPSDLERALFGAVQFSIIRHLRQPELEPLPPGLGYRIARAVLRGFVGLPPQPLKAKKRAAQPLRNGK